VLLKDSGQFKPGQKFSVLIIHYFNEPIKHNPGLGNFIILAPGTQIRDILLVQNLKEGNYGLEIIERSASFAPYCFYVCNGVGYCSQDFMGKL